MVLIGGRAGSGKDTAGRILKVRYPLRVVHLAAPLKGMMLLDDPLGPRGLIPQASGLAREALQELGELGRAEDQGLWVKALKAHLLQLAAKGVRQVAVCDIRYPNELEALQPLAAKTLAIYVARPGPQPPPEHPSEAVDPGLFDAVIVADSIHELRTKVLGLMTMVGLEPGPAKIPAFIDQAVLAQTRLLNSGLFNLVPLAEADFVVLGRPGMLQLTALLALTGRVVCVPEEAGPADWLMQLGVYSRAGHIYHYGRSVDKEVLDIAREVYAV